MGHPILRGLVQTLHVAFLSRQPDLAKRGGVLGAKPWVATYAPFGACRGKAGLGTLSDQGTFKLGGSAQNLQREFALRG